MKEWYKSIFMVAAMCCASVFGVAYGAQDVIRNVRYCESAGEMGFGDLYLPEECSADTPVMLSIHGGSWSSMDRSDVEFFPKLCVERLKFACFNINYRLASKANPWPACGDDCITAANFILSDGFASKYGIKPKKIWIMGGSAGGHLAIWTGLELPSEKVAGIVSISGIGDIVPDMKAHPGRYANMCGGGKPELSPMTLIRPNGPKILLTHATEDQVVPVESSRNFARAYRAAGNEVFFYEYPCEIERGLTGHCAFRRNADGTRSIITSIERRMAYFMLPPRVPEPKPLKSDIEITALYYPGTEHRAEWDMIDQTRPEVKPLLGWFDEGDPEVVDWQIKWAVEHGITSFLVDWYWNRGYRRLEHWVKAFQQAHHRHHFKWFMMYANHNQPGSHSSEDQVAVTRYWIENYFKTPEYYTVDGKPAVCIWDYRRIDDDFIAEAAAKGERLAPGEGTKRAFAISEQMVRAAGIPGIYWIDMWRVRKFNRTYAERRLCEGYRAAVHYGIEFYAPDLAPEAMKPGDTWQKFSYDAVVAEAPIVWNSLSRQKTLPFWVAIPTGWDDRPRSFTNSRIITERTPEKFAKICRAARKFCDESGNRHALIMPVNEWQEGSYIEPNQEYGFGMYDAIRDAFCEKPSEGWPKNTLPSEVGLGPYEFPPLFRSVVQEWNFKHTVEGWYRQPYGGGELQAKGGCLDFWVTRLGNYNIRQRVEPFSASKYGTFRIRMRITPNAVAGVGSEASPRMRLKWGTDSQAIIGKGLFIDPVKCVASCPVTADGEFHEYSVNLAGNSDWCGKVDELWFEAADIMHARISIDWMRFE